MLSRAILQSRYYSCNKWAYLGLISYFSSSLVFVMVAPGELLWNAGHCVWKVIEALDAGALFFSFFQKVHLSRVHKRRGAALLTLAVGGIHSWPGCRAACLLVCLFVCSFVSLQIPLVFLSSREVSNWNSTHLPHPLLGGTEVNESFWSNTCQLQAKSGTAVAWINSVAFFMQFWFSWLNSDCLPVLE